MKMGSDIYKINNLHSAGLHKITSHPAPFSSFLLTLWVKAVKRESGGAPGWIPAKKHAGMTV
jgi:hypothetical protein